MSKMDEEFFRAVQQSIQSYKISPIIETLVDVLSKHGFAVDRVQIPMNEFFGFRHPQYRAAIVTWSSGHTDVHFIPHSLTDAKKQFREVMKNSPFGAVVLEGKDVYRCPLRESNPYAILDNLQQDGYTDYVNFGIPLPQGQIQICSLATKSETGFADGIETTLLQLRYVLGLSIFGYYQAFVSHSIARTYLGNKTGDNVLKGQMFRGKQDSIEAGILFCDIRGFTQMSAQLGGEKIISVVNAVFQIVEEEISVYGGEILKFIGDALLIIFPREKDISDRELGQQLITVSKQSYQRVQTLAIELGLPLGIGFGGHIGSVQYGNIGTENRLDFTVMGPAVNLSSRIESMCKSLKAYLTLSSIAAEGSEKELDFLGEHSLKGVEGKTKIWGLLVEE